MDDKKKIIGYGIPGVLVLVIALVLMLKSKNYFMGFMVIILGAAALLAFRTWGEEFLAKRRSATPVSQVTDLEAKQSATEAKEKAVEEESFSIFGWLRKTVDKLSSVSAPEKRNPIFGEELDVIQKAIGEGTDKSLDGLYLKVAKDLSLLEELINTFQDEHRAIKEHVTSAKRREQDIKDLLEELGTARKDHRAAVEQVDRTEKLRVLEQLEARMRRATGEELTNTAKLEAEAEKVSLIIHNAHSRMQKTSKLLPRVKSAFIKSGDRGQQYKEMIKKLDTLNKDDVELASQAEEYRKLLYMLRTELSVLREVILGVTHSELTAERLKLQGEAEKADKEAAEAGRMLGKLFSTREALDANKSELEKEIDAKIKVMDTLSAQRAAWQHDLDNAIAASEKDPQLKGKISFVLKKDIGEQADALSSLMSLILLLNKSVNGVNADLDKTKEELNKATSMRDSLKTERDRLSAANAAAEKQAALARRQIDDLNKKAQEEEQKLRKAAQDERAKVQASIDSLNAQVNELKGIFDEASAQKRLIEVKFAPLEAQIADISATINTLTAKASEIKRDRDDKTTRIQSADASKKGIDSEKEKFIGTLMARNNELERERREVLDSIRALDKDSRRLETAISRMTSDRPGFAEKRDDALAGIRSFGERMSKAEQLAKENKARSDELEAALKRQQDAYGQRLMFFLKLIANTKERIRNISTQHDALKRGSDADRSYALSLKREKDIFAEEFKALTARMREVKKLALKTRSNADMQLVKKLEMDAENKRRAIDRLEEEARIHSDAADKEAVEAGKLRVLLSESRSHLAEAEQGHRRVFAELDKEIEGLRKSLAESRKEEEEKAGRIAERETEISNLQTEVNNLRQTIPVSAEIAQRNSLLEQELKDIREIHNGVRKLNDLKQALAEAVKQRLIDLLREKGDLRVRLTELEGRYADDSKELDTLRHEKEDLEHKLSAAEDALRQVKESMQPAPEAKKLLHDIELAQEGKRLAEEHREDIAKHLDDVKRSIEEKDKEIARLAGEVRKLQGEAAAVASSVEEDAQKAAKAEAESNASLRAKEFTDAQTQILDKIGEGRRFADDEPQKCFSLIDEAISLAERLKQQQLTDSEIFEVESLLTAANQIKQYAQQKMQAAEEPIEITEAEEVADHVVDEAGPLPPQEQATPDIEGKVGVLVPYRCFRIAGVNGYTDLSRKSAEMKILGSPGAGGGEVMQLAPIDRIVLDKSRSVVTFGRDSGCDVVITGDAMDIKSVSRNHFEVIFNEKGYFLKPVKRDHDYSSMKRYSKDGELSRLEKGGSFLLFDGDEFFLDTEENFCFRFLLVPLSDPSGKKSLSGWKKMMVEFPEIEEKMGFLELPPHAFISDIKGDRTKIMATEFAFRKIMLDKQQVKLGGAGSLETMENGIGIDPARDLFVVVNGQRVLCISRLPSLQAVITREGDDYYLEDKSGTATFVNYEDVRGKVLLKQGDIIHFGDNEPLFFTFSMEKFARGLTRYWNYVEVVFRKENFSIPKLKTAVGVIHLPKQASLVVADRKRQVRREDQLLLANYLASFGKKAECDVVIECDDRFVDARARPGSAAMNDEQFSIQRDFFGHHAMTTRCDEGIKILPKNGQEFLLKKDQFYTLQEDDVIKFFDSTEVFGIFKIEQLKVEEHQQWQRAKVLFKYGEAADKPESYYDAKKRINNAELSKPERADRGGILSWFRKKS